jgi:hypothetical protein
MTTDKNTFTVEQSDKLRSHVFDQVKQQTEASIGLAKALYEIHYGTIRGTEKKVVEAWGFSDFAAFCEKELKLHGGTCVSYVRVYDELCVRRNFDEGVLPPSITALRELAKISRKVTDQRELHSWIKKGNTLTACEFKDEVEVALYGKKGRKRQIGFSMSFAAAGRCLSRIRAVRDELGVDTNGEALERIINQYALGKPAVSEVRRLRKAS